MFALYVKKRSLIIRTDLRHDGSGKWNQARYCANRAIEKRMQTIIKS